MAAFRLVYWHDQRPTKDQVERILLDFFGDFLVPPMKWEAGRWLVHLRGHYSEMFASMGEQFRLPAVWGVEGVEETESDRERWIEVYLHQDGGPDSEFMCVITRRQDDATNALATHFAERMARAFRGQLE